MVASYKCISLEQIARQITSSLNLTEVLNNVVNILVDDFGASFARIWLVCPGDLCGTCRHNGACSDRKSCLHLLASAGSYTTLNGQFSRIPFGTSHIGRIAQMRKPLLLTRLAAEDGFPDPKWLEQNRFITYAGYPLMFQNELLGVMAIFKTMQLTDEHVQHLAGFADQAAIAIMNARLFREVKKLKEKLKAENIYLQEELRQHHDFEEIIFCGNAMANVLSRVEQVAPTDAAVLITGETGTGKELIARAIHSISPRKHRPLIKVNCANLSSSLIESELFGHEKGAFTDAVQQRQGRFELADGGTIFLDEIGDLPYEVQARLLRVLQDKEFERVGGVNTIKVDVRIIAATNHDLQKRIKKKKFRKDLFYRLNVFPIEVPILRDRTEDIPLLIEHFVGKYTQEFAKQIQNIPIEVIQALQNYSWPGNVRELENIIERAVILSRDKQLQIEEVFKPTHEDGYEAASSDNLLDVQRVHIQKVLKKTKWVIEGSHGAAFLLGINPATLRSRMKRLGIERPD